MHSSQTYFIQLLVELRYKCIKLVFSKGISLRSALPGNIIYWLALGNYSRTILVKKQLREKFIFTFFIDRTINKRTLK